MPATTHASGGRIVAENLSYSLPDGRTLFQDLGLAFGRERTGLIGPNGSGKTTLLRLLEGTLTPTAGTVHRSGVLGILPQDFLPSADQELAAVLGIDDRLAALHRLESGEGGAHDLDRVADDWDLPARARAQLDGFGLQHLALDRPVGSVSGGEATRVALAGLALARADMLLLDEPTNHLDLPSRESLYGFVDEWPGGLVCVSHDRALLDRMDRIVELSPAGVRIYGGDWTHYREQREAEDDAAARELDSARAAARAAERHAQDVRERQARRDARGRRSRTGANMPKILLNARKRQAEGTAARVRGTSDREVAERRARLDAARLRVRERERPRFALESTGLPPNRTVLEALGVRVTFPGQARPLLDDVSLRLVGPERVALVGPNGSGKTTLLRVVLGDLVPDEGTVRRLPDERVGFLDQRGARLDPDRSILDNYRARHPTVETGAARYALARFLFTDEMVHQTVGTLSGGQRLRAALACTLGGPRPPQLLVLDEPDNHLDLDALDALESALCEYDGALLVTSHDRTFLDAIGVKLLDVTTLSTLPTTT